MNNDYISESWKNSFAMGLLMVVALLLGSYGCRPLSEPEKEVPPSYDEIRDNLRQKITECHEVMPDQFVISETVVHESFDRIVAQPTSYVLIRTDNEGNTTSRLISRRPDPNRPEATMVVDIDKSNKDKVMLVTYSETIWSCMPNGSAKLLQDAVRGTDGDSSSPDRAVLVARHVIGGKENAMLNDAAYKLEQIAYEFQHIIVRTPEQIEDAK